jgi:hypothetical protein
VSFDVKYLRHFLNWELITTSAEALRVNYFYACMESIYPDLAAKEDEDKEVDGGGGG